MTTALLLGATGETGKELLKMLVESAAIAKVVTVGRRAVEETSNKVEHKVIDFDNIKQFTEAFSNIDKAYCCLGTTRGKAGKEGFIKVDYDYVLNSAELLKSQGCDEFHLLTSRGSNASSWFLYPSTKGKAEEAVRDLGFSNYSIYRPGLLLCEREEKRAGEAALRWLASWTDGSSSWSVHVQTVARSMLRSSIEGNFGTFEHADIVRIGKDSL